MIAPITACRVCASPDLTHVGGLGEQYVSDFVEAGQPLPPKVPIELLLCNSCTLVQQRYTAPQDFMYSRHYWYRSGVTLTMRKALKDVTNAVEELLGADLGDGDIVLDIGSNDGTLLRSYSHPRIIRVGVEPALNLRDEGEKGLHVFINDFWSAEVYFDLVSRIVPTESLTTKAKVVTAIGMFYDLPDPNTFIRDVAAVLAPDGVFVAQLMCLKNMLGVGDVGNLCHEHIEFYSIRSLFTLFNRHGLVITNVERNDVNGESYRIFARHLEYAKFSSNVVGFQNVKTALAADAGLDQPYWYEHFFAGQEMLRKRLREFVIQERALGKRFWVYGASTKGNVLLQYWGLDSTLIDAAADRSPEKWGKYTVGTGIPICPEAEFRAAKPDYALILPYAFRDEFLAREAEWRAMGGKFVFPLPKLEVV